MDQDLIIRRIERLEKTLENLRHHIYGRKRPPSPPANSPLSRALTPESLNSVKVFFDAYPITEHTIQVTDLYQQFKEAQPSSRLTLVVFVKELLRLYPQIEKRRIRPSGQPAKKVNILILTRLLREEMHHAPQPHPAQTPDGSS
jgi:hypothetical protein